MSNDNKFVDEAIYYDDRRHYAWFRGRVWLDTGLRDYLGRASLWSLTKDGEGVGASKWTPITGKELEACRRVWG